MEIDQTGNARALLWQGVTDGQFPCTLNKHIDFHSTGPADADGRGDFDEIVIIWGYDKRCIEPFPKAWHIPRELLTSQSPFFEQVYEATPDGIMICYYTFHWVFEEFVHWLYTGVLTNEKRKVGPSLEWADLYFLHLLGTEYQFPRLRIDTFWTLYNKLTTRLGKPPLVDLKLTESAMEVLGMDHPWTRFLIDYYAHHVLIPEVDEETQREVRNALPRLVQAIDAQSTRTSVRPFQVYLKGLKCCHARPDERL